MIWFLCMVTLGVFFAYYQWQLHQKRLLVIKKLRFDASIMRRIADKYPHLTSLQIQQVVRRLARLFLYGFNGARQRHVKYALTSGG